MLLVPTRDELICLDPGTAEDLRQGCLAEAEAERASEQLKALADPNRLRLAVALRASGELCVFDLSWVTQRPENLVSHHLRQLHAAGLVTRRREGKKVLYEVNARGGALIALALDEAEALA
jgi:DNA-binding transcriptional ArsR family regulator